jgi:hypothetical protein
MLASSVPILPICSIHRLTPLSSRTIIGEPVCAGFAGTGVQARHLQLPFVTAPRMAQRRQRRLSSLDFESTPAERTAHASVPREPLSAMQPSYVGLLCRKFRRNTQPQMEGVSPFECALTQKGGGGCHPVSHPVHFVFRQPRAQMP